MGWIIGLVFAMMLVYTGVNLIPGVADNATAVEGGVGSASGLGGMVMIVFATVIIFAALRSILAFGGETRQGDGWQVRLEGFLGSLPNTFITRQIFIRRSIGIGIVELAKRLGAEIQRESRIEGVHSIGLEPMELDIPLGILKVCNNYRWYVTSKHPDYVMYKMVGLHKRHRGLNCVYLVGKDSHTETPYLLRCPPNLARKSIKECVRWNIGAGKGDVLKEV